MPTTVGVPPEFEAAFRAAEKRVRKYFRKVRHAPAKGTIEIAGERYILVRAASMSVDFFQTVKSLYADQGTDVATEVAQNMLFDVAHAIGKADAQNFHARMGLQDPISRLSAGPIHFSHSGWAFVEISEESRPTPDKEFLLIYDHPFSFESDAWLNADEYADFAVCVMSAGYSSGWCTESFGMPLVASEIMCRAKGDPTCRFIMAHPSRIEEYIQSYLKDASKPTSKSVGFRIPTFFERQQVQEKMQRAAERYARATAAGRTGVWSYRPQEGTFFADENLKALVGYGKEEISDDPADWIPIVHEGDRESLLSLIERLTSGETEEGGTEHRMVRKDGETIWMLTQGAVARGANGEVVRVRGTCTDITERRQMQEALRESEAKFRAQYRSIPVPTYNWQRVDGDFVLVDYNQAAERITNGGIAKFVGTHASEMYKDTPEIISEFSRCFEERRVIERAMPYHMTTTGEDKYLVVRYAFVPPDLVMVHTEDITEIRKAEEALRESELRYRTILDSIEEGYFEVDLEGNMTFFNDSECRLLGYPPEELQGMSFRAYTTPESAEEIVRVAKHILSTDEPGHVADYRIVRKDGSTRIHELSTTAIRNPEGEAMGFRGVARDVTQRKQADEERTHLAMAVDQAVELVLITDEAGSIRYVNPAFERLTGYTREECLGNNPRILKSGNHNDAFYRNMWEGITQGKTWQGRIVNRKKDGTLYQAEMTISPVRDSDGRTQSFVSLSRDISREAELEGQLRQAQKLQAIGQLAAGIAHEINTPTQYIGDHTRFLQEAFSSLVKLFGKYRALLDMASPEALPSDVMQEIEALSEEMDLDFIVEETSPAIERILEGNRRIAEIVRAMREFAHPGAGDMVLVDLNRCIEDALMVTRNEWKYTCEVVTELDPGLPMVPCDLGTLNQVFLNLIVNAAHAVTEVVGERPATKGTITFSTRPSGEWAEIRISDTGPGIPEEIRSRVFEPFFTTKEVGKGTGQGLALVHSVIVEKHGGTVDIESAPGGGACFLIRLPVERKDMMDTQ